MDDLEKYFCQNKKCSEYGIRGRTNIHVRAWYGKHKDIRLLRCRVCKEKFSERCGTVLSDSRLPSEKVVSILEHVAEGNGMRKTGRLVRVGHMTVSCYTQLAGDHAETLHDELVDFSPQHRRGSTRREVEFRRKEGTTLRRKQSG